jgi:hypothetical protein
MIYNKYPILIIEYIFITNQFAKEGHIVNLIFVSIFFFEFGEWIRIANRYKYKCELS